MGFCFLEGNFFREIVQNSPKAVCIIYKGAHLGGSRGARAPLLFLPRPEIIHIRAQIFLPRPEIIYISAPPLFSPVGRQCSFHYEIIYTW